MLTHNWKVARITTTNATPVVAISVPLDARPEGISGDFIAQVDVRVAARSGASIATWRRVDYLERTSGNLSTRVSADAVPPQKDAALAATAMLPSVTSPNLYGIQVTGIAATTITWDVDVETRVYHG